MLLAVCVLLTLLCIRRHRTDLMTSIAVKRSGTPASEHVRLRSGHNGSSYRSHSEWRSRCALAAFARIGTACSVEVHVVALHAPDTRIGSLALLFTAVTLQQCMWLITS